MEKIIAEYEGRKPMSQAITDLIQNAAIVVLSIALIVHIKAPHR